MTQISAKNIFNHLKKIRLDWKPVTITIISAIITSVIALSFTVIQPLLLNPQFQIDYSNSNTSGCLGLYNNTFPQQCSNASKHIPIFLETISIENTGYRQAKNAKIFINTEHTVWQKDSDCVEGNITKLSDFEFLIDFSRFSQKIPCQVTFENPSGFAIQKVVVTAEDTPGHIWKSSDIVFLQGLFAWFAILMLVAYFTLLLFFIYTTMSSFSRLIKEKKLKIPRKINAYSCEIRFEEPENESHDVNAITTSRNRVIEIRNKWLETINSISEIKYDNLSSLNYNDEITIQMKEGIARVKIGAILVQQHEKYHRAADLILRSENKKVIRKIIETGKHPCWTFYWEIDSEFDVKTTVDRIRDKTERIPSSYSTGDDKGFKTMLAEYTLRVLGGITLRVELRDRNENQKGRIGIIYAGKPNSGFYHTRFLSMSSILLVLYDEFNIKKYSNLIQKACTME